MSVESILMELARSRGRAVRDRGNAFADVVGGVSQAPAQYYAGRDQDRARALREQQVGQQIELEAARGRREDAQATRQAGMDTRANTAQDAADMREKALKTLIGAGFEDDPAKFDLPKAVAKAREIGAEDLVPTLAAVHDKFAAPAPKTREVKVRNADGTETTKIVPDVPSEFTSTVAPKLHPVTVAGPTGGPIIKMVSEEELQKGVPAYRAPTDDKAKFWVMRDGKPLRVSESEYKPGDLPSTAGAAADKPSSGVEKKALTFFNRAHQAHKDLEALEPEIQKMSLAGQTYQNLAPNFMQTQTGQSYGAAQRAFTEARLRKDSGAAIPEQEFSNDRKTYFAQPGDSAATLEQKRRSRAAILASLAFESGRALKEFVGDDEEAKALIESFKTGSAKTAEQTSGGGMSYADYLKAKKK